MKADKRRLIITVHREGVQYAWSVRHNNGPANGTTTNGFAASNADAWSAAFRAAARFVGFVGGVVA